MEKKMEEKGNMFGQCSPDCQGYPLLLPHHHPPHIPTLTYHQPSLVLHQSRHTRGRTTVSVQWEGGGVRGGGDGVGVWSSWLHC